MTVGLLSFAALGQKVGQSVINAGSSSLGFANLAKGFGLTCTTANYPTLLNSDGFPTSSLAANISLLANTDPTYYGHYLMWWTGTGAIQFSPQAIIYSGGGSVAGLGAATSGSVNFNFAIGTSGRSQPTQAAPVEFAFGCLITAVSTNGGLVQFTTVTGALGNISTGASYQFNNLTGLGIGPNTDGSWTITKIDAQTMTLQGSSAVAGLVSITGTGGPGTQTEAILSVTVGVGPNPVMLSGQTISSWSNIVWCKLADQAAVIAGQLASPAYVSTFKSLNPRFIRFMDYSAVQNDRSSSFSTRTLTSNLQWGGTGHHVPGYYAGTITNGGSDNYTCANPSASPASGGYVDGEVVVGQINSTGANTGNNPTLGLTGRTGSAPILSLGTNTGAMQSGLFLTGSLPVAGKTVSFTFSGAGLVGTYSPTYTVAGGDTTLTILGNSLASKFRSDATLLAAGITVPFNGTVGGSPPGASFSFQFNPNIGGLGASPLVVSASDNGAPGATYTFGTVTIGSIANSTYNSFTYSALIGAWFCVGGSTSSGAGIHAGPPLEFYADLCNRAGVGCWIEVGIMWSAARITSTVTSLAGLLNGELKIGYSNETWNKFEAEWAPNTTLGNCLGLSNTSGDDQRAANSFTGLRVAQISQLATAAWTAAGRSRSQLHVQLSYQYIDMSPIGSFSTVPNRLNGALLNPGTNATLASFGGIGAVAITTNPGTGQPYNYSASPNRPIDLSDEMGGAPYFSGGQLNCVGSSTSGGSTSLSAPGAGTGTSCSISGTVLTIAGTTSGSTLPGPTCAVTGAGVTAGTFIISYGTGTGGAGTYNLNQSMTVVGPVTLTFSTTVTSYNALLLAAYNYAGLAGAYSSGAQQQAALDFLYNENGGIPNGDLYNGTLNGAIQQNNQLALWIFNGSNAVAADNFGAGIAIGGYDSSRASAGLGQLGYCCYEGGIQCAPINATDATSLATSLTNLGYTNGYSSGLPGAAAGPSGASDTATTAATNILTLYTAFKNDNRFKLLMIKYLQLTKDAGQWNGSAAISRISIAAQFGFEGPNVWSLYPGSINTTPYQSWNGLQTFDN